MSPLSRRFSCHVPTRANAEKDYLDNNILSEAANSCHVLASSIELMQTTQGHHLATHCLFPTRTDFDSEEESVISGIKHQGAGDNQGIGFIQDRGISHSGKSASSRSSRHSCEVLLTA